MDAIDRKILATLQAEGRIPVIDLAERVGLSPTPCARRIAKLEQDGTIRGYGARLDQSALGYPLTVFVFVELEGHARKTLSTFETAVARFDEVVECHLMTGTRDVLMKVVARDLAAFDRFLEESLLQVPGIRATRTSFSLRQMIGRETLPVG
ncbi:winged helix-turn-helix transcriptional regulator [Rhodobacterales bacterium HKCCE2091]|nr:winged helix-turn-helix transcriptional regulator [Rhodobacterales bacterium HKCCE2091]